MQHKISRMLTPGRLALATMVAALGACGDIDERGGAAADGDAVIEGKLELVLVGDGVTSHPEYFLSTQARGDRWLRLEFGDNPGLAGFHPTNDGNSHFHMVGGADVRLGGSFLDADTMLVDSLQQVAATAPGDGVATTGAALIAASPKKVAVILANFTNDASQPITPEAARAMVFTAATSTNAYYKEQSFGVRSLTGIARADGDVFGWYPINAVSTTCDYVTWGNLARTAAQNAGVNLSGYSQVIHYFPRSATCGWSGVGQLPGRYTWINGSSSSTIAHELGHNFGVHHASSLTCTNAAGERAAISDTCTSSEYGDPFDVMGRGYRHMNAYQKGRLGFLEAPNTATAVASGTFTIAPIEQPSTGALTVRVPIPATLPQLYYYVELRQPSSFDNFASTSSVTNGVLIHRNPDYATLARTQLIDASPVTSSFNDAALPVGGTFTDAAAAISISVSAVSATGATIQITR